MTVCNPSAASPSPVGRKRLEVIVTSREEARQAEEGGADRLEIVRALEQGGLTPSIQTVESILAVVRVPARVMIRETDSMVIEDEAQVQRLVLAARQIAQLPVDGLVLGYIRDGEVDQTALSSILAAAPQVAATFHRAFENLKAPLASLSALKQFPQIDRVLIRVREDGIGIDLAKAKSWQHFAAPQIRLIVGIGLGRTLLSSLRDDSDLWEIHAGRGAREPETVWGTVSRRKVAGLKSLLL